MDDPWNPMFGPMEDHPLYRVLLGVVKAEKPQKHAIAANRRLPAFFFDGTYPMPVGDRVAGYKGPPPPGASQ